MWTGSSQVATRKSRRGIPKINASANQREVWKGGASVVFLWYTPDGVTHSGRRSQLLLSATRCRHPSSYIGVIQKHVQFESHLISEFWLLVLGVSQNATVYQIQQSKLSTRLEADGIWPVDRKWATVGQWYSWLSTVGTWEFGSAASLYVQLFKVVTWFNSSQIHVLHAQICRVNSPYIGCQFNKKFIILFKSLNDFSAVHLVIYES